MNSDEYINESITNIDKVIDFAYKNLGDENNEDIYSTILKLCSIYKNKLELKNEVFPRIDDMKLVYADFKIQMKNLKFVANKIYNTELDNVYTIDFKKLLALNSYDTNIANPIFCSCEPIYEAYTKDTWVSFNFTCVDSIPKIWIQSLCQFNIEFELTWLVEGDTEKHSITFKNITS